MIIDIQIPKSEILKTCFTDFPAEKNNENIIVSKSGVCITCKIKITDTKTNTSNFIRHTKKCENYCTISLVVPSLFQLINYLNQYESKNKNLSAFRQELESQLRFRFKSIFVNIENPSTLDENGTDFSPYISSFLDPFFKNEWIMSLDIDEVKKLEILNKLKNQLMEEFSKMRPREKNVASTNDDFNLNVNESQAREHTSSSSN
ncbi:hypothetical protein BpHYR1_036098 [Brachionus plicatilis]|uniref:Uncharacterized protein n=1 Tax=Brachionus plicatilis TaxID=10195 RepID=A0A3M7R333_BRAPC|nr:hypothetical protein BpHYR1_036098 [Brachionus plicatilis]